MAKEQSSDTPDFIAGGCSGHLPEAFSPLVEVLFPPVKPFDPEAVITQLLDNCVGILDAQRLVADDANMRGIYEVRLHGHKAAMLLTGYDDELSYWQLAEVIRAMKAGIARRRVALES